MNTTNLTANFFELNDTYNKTLPLIIQLKCTVSQRSGLVKYLRNVTEGFL